MKIDILCKDGSPLGVTSKTVWGDDHRVGVGGAELSLITMCETWAEAGYEVTLYNDPYEIGVSPFEQRNMDEFDPNSDRDVLITFRTPNVRSVPAKGFKVWWSTDQYTSEPFQPFAPFMDKIVCISEFHKNYFSTTYGINDKVEVIDLPVRVDDFLCEANKPLPSVPYKIPYRMIFTSIPDRGLMNLYRMFGAIQKEVPEVSLVITSDYRLWGVADARVEHHRVKWGEYDNITFLGAVPRERMIKEVLKAQVMLYPCIYEELFCISVAEAQVADVYPITPAIGALETTNMGKVFYVNPNDPRNDVHFIEETVERLNNPFSESLASNSKHRFSPKVIKKQWDDKVFV